MTRSFSGLRGAGIGNATVAIVVDAQSPARVPVSVSATLASEAVTAPSAIGSGPGHSTPLLQAFQTGARAHSLAGPACLTAHPDSPMSTLHVKGGVPYYLSRDVETTKSARAPFAFAYRWFCKSGNCCPVAGEFLNYVDDDHSTIAFREYLAMLATDALFRAVKE